MIATLKKVIEDKCVLCHKQNCADVLCHRMIDRFGTFIIVDGKPVLTISKAGWKRYNKIK